MAAGRRIYIIGFPGSGKSTTGKKLSTILGWKYKDLDKEIELKAGKAIKDIFSTYGEDYFREIEAERLFNLKTYFDTVISVGGGTPCYGSNMEFLNKTGLVVYLKLTPSQLKSRLDGSSTVRPLINQVSKTELLQYISAKLSEREKYYLKASIIVDGIDLDIKTLSNIVKAKLEG
jgi:shikimate kinase